MALISEPCPIRATLSVRSPTSDDPRETISSLFSFKLLAYLGLSSDVLCITGGWWNDRCLMQMEPISEFRVNALKTKYHGKIGLWRTTLKWVQNFTLKVYLNVNQTDTKKNLSGDDFRFYVFNNLADLKRPDSLKEWLCRWATNWRHTILFEAKDVSIPLQLLKWTPSERYHHFIFWWFVFYIKNNALKKKRTFKKNNVKF